MTKEEKKKAIFNEYMNLARAGIDALKNLDLLSLEMAKAATYANISVIAATPVSKRLKWYSSHHCVNCGMELTEFD